MAKGCKKCDPHELCEECPEWIFTLADLIMCMMGLFVLLWVLKPSGNPQAGHGNAATTAGQMSADRLNEVMAAIRTELDYKPNSSKLDDIDLEIVYRKLKERATRGGQGTSGDAEKPKEGAEGVDSEVTTIRIGKQTAEGGPLIFEAGEATVDDSMKAKVVQLAKLIRGHRNVVMVRGHTSLDDFQDSATPDQKMVLSIQRAQAIADLLIANKVEPDIIRVQGCSTYEPVKQRAYSNASQAANRRVEVEVTSTLVSELQDSSK